MKSERPLKIELRMGDDSIIAPKQIEIEGYHIIDKDDKLVIIMPEGATNIMYDEARKGLDEFAEFGGHLLLSHGFEITVLKKDED